ncbi:MAG: sugar transferase, partial [Chloroflexota bacterium]|nr:sugar transferase [Chloroflexota bacterium]
VLHFHDNNIGAYARRKFYIGYWKALLTRWHPERMVQDSHTPQVLKVQIVLLALLMGLLPLAMVGIAWSPLRPLWAGVGLLTLGFLTTTLPFLRKLTQKSAGLALIGPVMLGVRALALGGGFLAGTIHFAGTLPGARQPLIPGWKRLVKRTVDIAGALIGLAISIPLVGMAAIAIKLDSPGPIFYYQVRIGENGRPFRMVKLRSMVNNAEARLADLIDLDTLTEPVYKIINDPRITKVGKVLRRTSLDEAPQFYNVLVGEMSLVGPRPEEAKIVALYRDQERRRLAVKPGLTGPMQVSGRGDLSLAERLQLEMDYIDHYSLTRDLEILLRTLPAIVRGRGAY